MDVMVDAQNQDPFEEGLSGDEFRLSQELLREGLLSEAQMRTALEYQQSLGGKLAEIVRKLGFVDENLLNEFLARRERMRTIDVSNRIIDRELMSKIPRSVIEGHEVIPFRQSENTILLAMSEAMDYEAIEEIQFLTSCVIETGLAPRPQILAAIARFYNENPSVGAPFDGTQDDALPQAKVMYVEADEAPIASPTPSPTPSATPSPEPPQMETPPAAKPVVAEEVRLTQEPTTPKPEVSAPVRPAPSPPEEAVPLAPSAPEAPMPPVVDYSQPAVAPRGMESAAESAMDPEFGVPSPFASDSVPPTPAAPTQARGPSEPPLASPPHATESQPPDQPFGDGSALFVGGNDVLGENDGLGEEGLEGGEEVFSEVIPPPSAETLPSFNDATAGGAGSASSLEEMLLGQIQDPAVQALARALLKEGILDVAGWHREFTGG